MLIRKNKDFEDQAKIFANPNSAKQEKGHLMPIQREIR